MDKSVQIEGLLFYLLNSIYPWHLELKGIYKNTSDVGNENKDI